MTRLLSACVAIVATTLVPAAGADESASTPIIVVHGQSGSAQQFETHMLRFTSNGYPPELLYAFEYDTSLPINPTADLDAFIDDVLTETGATQVFAVGHSRGTTVWIGYLDDPSFDGPAKVAKYVNIDGRRQPTLPGGVPTIGIWGEWNTADSGFNRIGNVNAQIGPNPADNYYFGTKSHTEVASSAEAFALMYEFFTGSAPATTDVVPEPPGQVEIAGRAVIFPENIGYDGATVELWRVRAETGQRIGSRPRETFAIDESGDFGPVKVNGQKSWELAVVRPATATSPETVHHFYFEPFSRSDRFIRLNTSRPGQSLEAFLPRSPDFTNLVISRQKEFWGDQGSASDALLIDGVNVATPLIAPRAGVNLAVFAYDDGLDGVTDLAKGELFPFPFITFLTAADVSIAASPDVSGSVAVTDVTRGSGNASTINVPNWPSDVNRITVQFRDDDQDVEAWTELKRGGR